MRLNKLVVHRLPGITSPFTLETDSLVNIITGPNESGKSSLVRAFHKLLWAHEKTGPLFRVEAHLEIEGIPWEAVRDEGRPTRWWKQGQPAEPPVFPEGLVAKCFQLGVLDLVLPADGPMEKELAAAINREMSGGVDLSEVAASLFTVKPRLAASRFSAFQKARNHRGELLRQQQLLADRELDLAGQRKELAQVQQAAASLALLEKAERRHQVLQELARVQNQLESFPPGQAQVRPDDLENLTQWWQQQKEKTAARARLGAAMEERDRRMAALGPVAAAADPSLLEKTIKQAEQVARELVELEASLAREQGILRQLVEELDPHADEQAEGPLGHSSAYRDLARVYDQLARNKALDGALDSLLHLPNLQAGPSDPREKALLEDLRRWILEPELPSRASWLWVVPGGLVAMAAGWLLRAQDSFFLMMLFLTWGTASLGYAAWQWWNGRKEKNRRSRLAADLRERAEQIGRPLPQTWNRAEASAHLAKEIQRIAQQEARQEVRSFLSGQKELRNLEQTNAREMVDRLREKHGLSLDRDHPDLLHLLNTIPRYRVARDQVAGLQALVADKQALLQKSQAAIAQDLVALGWPAPETLLQARHQLEQLIDRLNDYQRQETAQQRDRREDQHLAEDLAEIENGLARLKQRLQVPPELDEPAVRHFVRRLVDQYPAWQESSDTVRALELELKNGLPPEGSAEFETWSPDQREARKKKLQQQVASQEELRSAMAQTEIEVNQARHSLQIAQAGAALARAREDLESAHHQERKARLGRLLLQDVDQAYHRSARPLVLAKAADNFLEFTQGRYGLLVRGDLLALDQESGASLGLAQLSDGTRAQLLLAVRLAFITTNEKTIQPPLFLDESLTTSDPERFTAIVGSLAHWSHQHQRQIFYLSNRPTEAWFWRTTLQRQGLPEPRILNLGALRKMPLGHLPDPENETIQLPPAPEGQSAQQYGQQLGVPALDPWNPATRTHLWYLLWDDLDLLYRLVLAAAPTLGRWQARKKALGTLVEMTHRQERRLSARGRLLAAFFSHWQVGRNRPLAFAALEESGLVSKAHRDKVRALLDSCQGDADCLVAGLRQKKVPHFRVEKRVQLEEFLSAEGYLDSRSPLSDEDLLERIATSVQNDVQIGILDWSEIRTLITSWTWAISGSS